jgi:hypothetical protein
MEAKDAVTSSKSFSCGKPLISWMVQSIKAAL